MARRYAQSSSFQMALLFTVLCGTAVLILGYFGYYFNRGHFVYGTEAVINTEIAHLATDDPAITLQKMAQRENRIFLLLDTSGQKIAGTLDRLPADVSLLAEGTIIFNMDDKKYAAKIHSYPDGRKLLVGVDITAVSKDYRFMQFLSILSIVLMVLVIVTSYLISRFVVINTNRIAQTAQKIMRTGDLSQRIELQSKWDDLSYMAAVLNDFLDRIEVLMQGIRQVSDNIAHDLRTPLTRLRNNLESLRDRAGKDGIAGNAQDYDRLIAEADHLLQTFGALLRISRIETGKQHGAFAKVNLKSLLEDALELYEPLAEDKHIDIETDFQDVFFACDKDLLFQVFANLLDNALKFTPENGQIGITLGRKGKRIVVTVADTGTGIADQDKEKVFERFYRGEKSRHTAGSGLGLSLVAAVVGLHAGKIELEDNHPGLRVSVIL